VGENGKKIPSQIEVRQIFSDTYNVFYKKWKDISKPEDWAILMQDMHQIDQKYDCSLCRQILLELVKVIEHDFVKKEGSK
jgi:hypothetical protein